MARGTKDGWDFVKQGSILQYKEDGMILIIEVLEDNSTDKQYDFLIKAIAGNMDFPKEFNVIYSKKFNALYSGMCQFYEHAEYMMLPLGKPWKYIFDKEKLEGSNFHWKEDDQV